MIMKWFNQLNTLITGLAVVIFILLIIVGYGIARATGFIL